MNDIASYYIKTLFLWKIDETKDRKYWQKGLSTLFREMVEILYKAIQEKKIKYFWHEENNLIEGLKPTVQRIYADSLKNVLDAIDNNDVDKVAAYLLTVDEFQEFKKSDFYQKQMEVIQRQLASGLLSSGSQNSISRQESTMSVNSNSDCSRDATDSLSQDASLIELVRAIHDKVNVMADDQKRMKKIEADCKGSITRINSVAEMLKEINDKIDSQNETLKKLETVQAEEKEQLKDKLDLLMDKMASQNERLKKLEIENRNYKDNINSVGDALAVALDID